METMKIAVASQNRREVTGHAGRCRKFWIYTMVDGEVRGRELLELPKERSFHEHDVRLPHPLDGMRALITGGMGSGLARKLAARGIEAVATPARDPDRAVADWLAGSLERLAVEEEHAHGGGHA
ncbi:MAG: NifB/NifX family molybdenum-iron cluster-binding protein [Gammaproteobacteria bacterium]|jgi:predicted Fe-Mo cluster-binding NifX family protein